MYTDRVSMVKHVHSAARSESPLNDDGGSVGVWVGEWLSGGGEGRGGGRWDRQQQQQQQQQHQQQPTAQQDACLLARLRVSTESIGHSSAHTHCKSVKKVTFLRAVLCCAVLCCAASCCVARALSRGARGNMKANESERKCIHRRWLRFARSFVRLFVRPLVRACVRACVRWFVVAWFRQRECALCCRRTD